MVDARTLRHGAQAKNNTEIVPQQCDKCGRDLRVRSSDFDPSPSTDKPVKVGEVENDEGEMEPETEPASEHEIAPASDTKEAECPVHGKVWGNTDN